MRIGISAFAWTSKFDRSHLGLFPAIKKIGLSAIEIPMFDPVALPISEIRRESEASGLECTVCAILPKQFNPISPDAETRRGAIKHLMRCIEAAAAMGSKLIGGPLLAPIGYLPKHRPKSQEWSWAIETVQALARALEVHDMTLSIEPVNRSESFFLRTAAEANQLCDAIGNPRIGVTVDTFHANIEEKSIAEAIATLGPRLKHIHASENDRGLLGDGHVPFPEIVSMLKKIGYTGYLMIEGFGYSPREKHAPGRLWASMDISPEALAVKGKNYLEGLIRNPAAGS